MPQAIRIARKSLTLVPVGPVTSRSPASVERGPGVVRRRAARAGRRRRRGCGRRCRRRRSRRRCPRSRRCRRCRRRARGCRRRRRSRARSASRNSPLRPPLPRPRSVTVVSPPESSTTGRRNGRSRAATSRAIAAWTRPTSRASPSMASDRIAAGQPRGPRRRLRRLERDRGRGDDVRPRRGRRPGRPGRGRRSRRRARCVEHRRRQVEPVAAHAPRAPPPGRPGRARSGRRRRARGRRRGCRRRSARRRAPGARRAASRPPLMPRDVLAQRVHLGDRRARGEQRPVDRDLVARASARAAGEGRSAEPPPAISAMTRSSGPRPATSREQPLARRRARRRRARGAPPRAPRCARRARRSRSG